MTGIELELYIGMHYLIIEKEMRVDISYIVKRHSKANNKYMQSYNINEPSKFIVYLDENSLFGWAMTQYLPYSGFQWLNQKEIDKFVVNLV